MQRIGHLLRTTVNPHKKKSNQSVVLIRHDDKFWNNTEGAEFVLFVLMGLINSQFSQSNISAEEEMLYLSKTYLCRARAYAHS